MSQGADTICLQDIWWEVHGPSPDPCPADYKNPKKILKKSPLDTVFNRKSGYVIASQSKEPRLHGGGVLIAVKSTIAVAGFEIKGLGSDVCGITVESNGNTIHITNMYFRIKDKPVSLSAILDSIPRRKKK